MSGRFKPVALDAAFNIAGTESVMGRPTAEQAWEDYRGMLKVNGAGVLFAIKHEIATMQARASAASSRWTPITGDALSRLRLCDHRVT